MIPVTSKSTPIPSDQKQNTKVGRLDGREVTLLDICQNVTLLVLFHTTVVSVCYLMGNFFYLREGK